MLFDLDRFKEVNDTYGHDTGDLLLNQVSRRLTSMSSATDTFYRLGGDEFALLSSGLTETAAVLRAKEISDHISQPYTINNQLIKLPPAWVSFYQIMNDALIIYTNLPIWPFTKRKRRFAADQSLPSVDAAKTAGKQNP